VIFGPFVAFALLVSSLVLFAARTLGGAVTRDRDRELAWIAKGSSTAARRYRALLVAPARSAASRTS